MDIGREKVITCTGKGGKSVQGSDGGGRAEKRNID